MDDWLRGLATGIFESYVKNADIAELLARVAVHAKQPLQPALRRVAPFCGWKKAEEITRAGKPQVTVRY